MTTLVKKAFTEVSKLSDMEQNIVAQWILDELRSEKKWENAFAESEDVLEQLANEALEEHKKGKTKLLKIN